MINKKIIDFNIQPILSEINCIIATDPVGRINNSTGKTKPNGAQHSLVCNEVLSPLFLEMTSLANKHNLFVGDVWTNVCYPNAIGGKHKHIQATIAGCFYVYVPDNSSSLEFETGEVIYPKAGEFYWWDANIIHWTNENKSNETRISIAFNLNMPL
jgi:hypothetical protein